MAKGTGLIGNFKGKVGNTVGYKLSASNNGQTQGIRVYQPIVKNPKTAAQAEQRAKLLAVNATYRTLKMVIDRGNEGLPYGNKSRLAWLKGALKATNMPWFEKGAIVTAAVGCPLTKGSLTSVNYEPNDAVMEINVPGLPSSETTPTVAVISAAMLAAYSNLKNGDQITMVMCYQLNGALSAVTTSFVLDTTDTTNMTGFTQSVGKLGYEIPDSIKAYAVIVSRQGDNGAHLRSTEYLTIAESYIDSAPYDATSKAAAIASYQSSGYVNADWSEEPID